MQGVRQRQRLNPHLSILRVPPHVRSTPPVPMPMTIGFLLIILPPIMNISVSSLVLYIVRQVIRPNNAMIEGMLTCCELKTFTHSSQNSNKRKGKTEYCVLHFHLRHYHHFLKTPQYQSPHHLILTASHRKPLTLDLTLLF